MPNVVLPFQLEFLQQDAPRGVLANSQDDFTFVAPDGYQLISWGFSSMDPELQVSMAMITSENLFRGVVDNPTGSDLGFRWQFLLLKV
jgi:hypothetical protein